MDFLAKDKVMGTFQVRDCYSAGLRKKPAVQQQMMQEQDPDALFPNTEVICQHLFHKESKKG